MIRSVYYACVIFLCAVFIYSAESIEYNNTSIDSEGLSDISKSDTITAQIDSSNQENTAVIFFTGNTLSTLQPCGCSTGQLGGFSRRGTVLNTVLPENRFIIDTGNFLINDTEQDIIKFEIIYQALSMLEYDLVNFNKHEIYLAADYGLLQLSPFNIITNSTNGYENARNSYTGRIFIGSKPVSVNVVSIDTKSDIFDRMEELIPNTNDLLLNILIINNREDAIISYLANNELFDVVVCPTSSDEPEIVEKSITKPLFITTGQFGKYVGKLSISLNESEQLILNYSKIAITEKLSQDPVQVDLYKYYQQTVAERDLLGKIARGPLPDGLEFLGSKSCNMSADCHPYEENIWSKNPHAHAYQTLVDAGSQYDPECVGCHVVGLGYESGFKSEEASLLDLRNVGCESCHGPGSKHLEAILLEYKDNKTTEPKVKCEDCHTPEHDPGFVKEEKIKKIIHWKEPLKKESVKN